MTRPGIRRLCGLCGLLAISAVAGCATGNDPGGSSLPLGENCKSIRAQLNRLDNKGVPSLIEAKNAGKKLSGPQRADVDAYNRLLNQYLGARCHV